MLTRFNFLRNKSKKSNMRKIESYLFGSVLRYKCRANLLNMQQKVKNSV